MKTNEELNVLKEEVNTLNRKLRELTDEELAQVTGGEGGKSVWILGGMQMDTEAKPVE